MTTYNDADMMNYYLETEQGREEWRTLEREREAYEEYLYRDGSETELSEREKEAREQNEREYQERIRKYGAPF